MAGAMFDCPESGWRPEGDGDVRLSLAAVSVVTTVKDSARKPVDGRKVSLQAEIS